MRRSGFKIIVSLLKMLGDLAKIIFLAVVNGTLGFLCSIGISTFGAIALAKLIGEPIVLSYPWLFGILLGLGVLRGVLRYFEQYSNHFIAFKLLAELRYRIFGALRKLCPAKLENKEKGNLIALITADIETLEVFYAHTISPVCIAVTVSVLVTAFLALFVSPWFALVALAAYAFVGILLPLVGSKLLKTTGMEYRTEFAQFNGYFLDSVKGVKDILVHNGETFRGETVHRMSTELAKKSNRLKNRTATMSAMTNFAVTFFTFCSLLVGVLLLPHGLSVGKLLVGVVTLYASFGAVIAVSNLPSNLNQTFASGERLLQLLEEKPAVEEICGKSDFDFCGVTVKDLRFGYHSEQEVLDGVDLTVPQGKIVGIVGPSGCGKSTLLKLLLRFWQKESGSIDYGGTDIDEINTKSLLQNVTLVSQSTYLFCDTIANNLKIAKPDATEEEMREACRQASVDDFIQSLPQGYQTNAGMLGDRLSSGEKQRIGLARAFLHGSKFILLDEPTSNIDSINEGIVLAALKRQKQKSTILLVSHRESTMAIADVVYRFDHGKLTKIREA